MTTKIKTLISQNFDKAFAVAAMLLSMTIVCMLLTGNVADNQSLEAALIACLLAACSILTVTRS